VVKSTWFPPYDPWFAGGIMNYYYFGFVIIGSLIEALGIVPSVAYNLAVPTLFAMTGVGAYTLANNLAGGDRRRGHRAGLLGVLLVVVLGNLGEVRLLFKGFAAVGDVTFESLIPGYPDVVSALVGVWKVVVQGRPLQFRPEWWYWDASRVISARPGEVGVINEFPAFTFLYADLHAHMMALPFTQIALAIALQWGLHLHRQSYRRTLRGYLWSLLPRPLAALPLAGLVAGALRATNTWDWPTYLGVMAVSSWTSLLALRDPAKAAISGPEVSLGCASNRGYPPRPTTFSFPYHKLTTPFLFILLGEILFRPFTTHFAAAYSAFRPWEGARTPLGSYLIMHGQFIFPLIVLALVQLRRVLRQLDRARDEHITFAVMVMVASSGVLLLTLLLLGISIAWIVVPLGMAAAALVLAPQPKSGMLQRRRRLLWLWVGTALAISLLVELLVLKGDIGRMNTVFKFYFQVWMLLAVCASVGVERILYHARIYHGTEASEDAALARRTLAVPVSEVLIDGAFGVMLVLLFSAALYPALGIPAKARDRWAPAAPRTLDGMAFIPYATQHEHGTPIPLEVDYRVIRWLQENVEGSPTIIEGQAKREYLWGNRVSIYTGLPSVAAWRWHQVQQRQVMPGGTVEQRQNDIRRFYNTAVPEEAFDVLQRYGVTYVVLAPYERAYMLPEGEPKFAQMVERGWLEVAYQEPEATIYRVRLE
jgi:YYY domain-containing protein